MEPMKTRERLSNMYVSISQAKQDGNEYMMLACARLTDNQEEFLILLFAEQSMESHF